MRLPELSRKMLQRILNFIAKIFGIRKKPSLPKKEAGDDIYPMW
jgi:hypothetical protein